ncbi:MAG: hypothetical protein K9M99_04080 [Candidatus Cloacimonetes bacterium]|nr:hypothetical protein [Candidatus Cloacimonadota bacterium]
MITFKPAEILDFSWEETERDWSNKQKAYFAELDFFENKPEITILRKLPYNFYYHFLDKNNKRHKLMIEDWDTGMLYWNCFKKTGTAAEALNLVKKKYLEEFGYNKDSYFFMGTSLKHHATAKNPFLITGMFTPPIVDCEQIELDI